MCSDLHLEEQRAEICQAWARQLEEDNEVGLALSYFEKGHGFADIERICWKTFENLLLSGIPKVVLCLVTRWKRHHF
jgi:hypothetical protein